MNVNDRIFSKFSDAYMIVKYLVDKETTVVEVFPMSSEKYTRVLSNDMIDHFERTGQLPEKGKGFGYH